MKKTFNPASVRRPFGNYNHGLLVPPGASLLVTSGQLGIGLDDAVPSDITAQAELCFEAIKAILEEAEMSFADVIRISGFVTRREDFPAYMAVRDRYTLDPKPVSTLLVIGGFTRPEFLVEVEVTAAKIAFAEAETRSIASVRRGCRGILRRARLLACNCSCRNGRGTSPATGLICALSTRLTIFFGGLPAAKARKGVAP